LEFGRLRISVLGCSRSQGFLDGNYLVVVVVIPISVPTGMTDLLSDLELLELIKNAYIVSNSHMQHCLACGYSTFS
jgi:hypothetical protein